MLAHIDVIQPGGCGVSGNRQEDLEGPETVAGRLQVLENFPAFIEEIPDAWVACITHLDQCREQSGQPQRVGIRAACR